MLFQTAGGMMGIRYSKPPVLMHDVIGDLGAVVSLLESQTPYNPLGGWYNPGADPHARTRPMWFQKDWVHDVFAADGSEDAAADRFHLVAEVRSESNTDKEIELKRARYMQHPDNQMRLGVGFKNPAFPTPLLLSATSAGRGV